jgi:hypothetical protein
MLSGDTMCGCRNVGGVEAARSRVERMVGKSVEPAKPQPADSDAADVATTDVEAPEVPAAAAKMEAATSAAEVSATAAAVTAAATPVAATATVPAATAAGLNNGWRRDGDGRRQQDCGESISAACHD